MQMIMQTNRRQEAAMLLDTKPILSLFLAFCMTIAVFSDVVKAYSNAELADFHRGRAEAAKLFTMQLNTGEARQSNKWLRLGKPEAIYEGWVEK